MSESLRVGVDLAWLRPGDVGGSETAAVGTLRGLAALAAPGIDVRLYAQSSFRAAYPELADRFATVTVPVPGGTRGSRVAAETVALPVYFARDRIDVVHWYGGVVAPGSRRHAVLTLHDVQPLEPGSAFGSTKKLWLARMIPSSVARAGLIAVPSAFVRERLCALVDVDPGRVVVVPHGFDPSLSAVAIDREALRTRFRLEGRFVLYPAITYPHKNHLVLVEAFARIARTSADVTLVLSGGSGSAESDVMALVERRGVGDRVRRVGRVSPGELAGLLREAAVMAFPSRYEGFGLPVIEALGMDTPVIAARAGSLPEVLGNAGRLVEPDDVDAWAEALDATLDGAQGSPEASQRRAVQAGRFSWEQAAHELVGLYGRVARVPVDRP